MDRPFAYDHYVTGKNFVGRKMDCNILGNLLEKGEHKFWSEAVQAEGGSAEKIVNVPELALHRSFGEGPFNNETSNWGDERWYANNIRNVFWLIKKDSDSALPDHDEYLNAE